MPDAGLPPRRQAVPKDPFDQASAILTRLTGNIAQLRKLVAEMGTAKDSAGLRSRLRALREESSQAAQDSMQIIQSRSSQPLSPPEKRRLAKLTEQQKMVITEFQTVEREYLSKERQYAPPAPPQDTRSVGQGEVRLMMHDDEDVQRQALQSRYQVDRENAQELAAAQRDLVMLSGMVMEVNQMVREQGIMVDELEANTVDASANVDFGTDELAKAREYQRAYRCKCCICWTIVFVIVAAVVIGLVVHFTKGNS